MLIARESTTALDWLHRSVTTTKPVPVMSDPQHALLSAHTPILARSFVKLLFVFKKSKENKVK
jgi:hypothetical protein